MGERHRIKRPTEEEQAQWQADADRWAKKWAIRVGIFILVVGTIFWLGGQSYSLKGKEGDSVRPKCGILLYPHDPETCEPK